MMRDQNILILNQNKLYSFKKGQVSYNFCGHGESLPGLSFYSAGSVIPFNVMFGCSSVVSGRCQYLYLHNRTEKLLLLFSQISVF